MTRTLVLTAWLLVFAPALPVSADADPLARWQAAASADPDDPDLAWGHAAALRDAGDHDGALRRFRAIAERWPVRATEAGYEAGRLLSTLGRHAPALRVLNEVIVADPLHGRARLQRALALQALDRDAEADRELAVLERVAPELRAEALLLRAVRRLKTGDPEGSADLLRIVVAIGADDEPTAAARMILASLEGGRAPRLVARAEGGAALDSNVTLDSGTLPSSDQSDVHATWTGTVAWRPLDVEWADWSIGLSYGETSHEKLKAFDLESRQAFTSLVFPLPGPGVARIDASVLDSLLADERYRRSWQVRPSWVLPLDARRALRLYGGLERRAYAEPAVFKSLDREGVEYAAGVEHAFALGERAAGAATLEVGRFNSEASRDPLVGFEGDYDNRRITGGGRVRIPLWRALDVRLDGAVTYERFIHRSLVDAFTDGGVGTPDPTHRRQTGFELGATLGWELVPGLRAELRWRGTRQHSNVDVYDYERHVVGVHLVAERAWRW